MITLEYFLKRWRSRVDQTTKDEIQLFIDGKFVADSLADRSRPDVVAAGWSKDEWHGYTFQLTSLDGGLHEARIYALHDSGDGVRKSLQLVGEPIGFSVDASGRLHKAPALR